jgi:dienelactone hydrolase
LPSPPQPRRAVLAGIDRHERRAQERERARRQRTVRRRWLCGLAVLATVGLALAALALTTGSRSARSSRSVPAAASRPRLKAPFAVGLTVMRIVDDTRSVRLPAGETVPRTLETYIRYPALPSTAAGDRPDAPAARAAGPFPLIVFGHGFALTPSFYAGMLRAWVRAGYIVAAPVFPLSNANAPGGPDESDLPNQPADMRLVISRVLAAGNAASGRLSRLINERRIAVAGQSDGGDSALAVAYDRRYRDPRVGAAVILSGAEIPGIGGFQLAPGGPPLLATQGTADTINPPYSTDAFYAGVPRPKYLLELVGASHLPPYSSQAPQLGVVERVTLAFLDRYLKRTQGSLERLRAAGNLPGVATLDANP